MVRIALGDSFLFCCVRGPHPAFQKPLLPCYTRGLPAGASGVGLRVSAHSCPLGENPPAGLPVCQPALQALGSGARLSLHPAPQPAREGRRGTAEARACPGAGAGGRARAADRDRLRIASRAGTGSTHLGARRPRANLVPQELSRRLPLARRDRKCCCVWDAAVH